MKKWIVLPALAVLVVLTGCSALLERSYSAVEPYTDRYWESGVEDTLKAENYQDLVNSLLMLVDQRAEEGTIRCYADNNPYFLANTASREVREETTLGSYLLEKLTFTYEKGDGYCTITYQLTYREDAEDMDGLMTPLSDTQSLVDLLRVAVREGHQKLTAQFLYETPKTEIKTAVEGLWQELYLAQLPPEALQPIPEEEEVPDPEAAEPTEEEETALDEEGETTTEEPPVVEIPPCPWQIVFYPDMAEAGIVEILLKP